MDGFNEGARFQQAHDFATSQFQGRDPLEEEEKDSKNRGGNQKFFEEERAFLESCFQKNKGKWSKFETGRIARTLGVPRKKVTMWKWHRSLKERAYGDAASHVSQSLRLVRSAIARNND